MNCVASMREKKEKKQNLPTPPGNHGEAAFKRGQRRTCVPTCDDVTKGAARESNRPLSLRFREFPSAGSVGRERVVSAEAGTTRDKWQGWREAPRRERVFIQGEK